jgi:hypothetical protein
MSGLPKGANEGHPIIFEVIERRVRRPEVRRAAVRRLRKTRHLFALGDATYSGSKSNNPKSGNQNAKSEVDCLSLGLALGPVFG